MTKLRVASHELESKLLKGSIIGLLRGIHSLKGVIWEYYRAFKGDTRSLDYGS